jgi:hypothetical protein
MTLFSVAVRVMGVSMAIALAVVTICSFATSAGAATGLEPGVHVDPGSPAAKEYALPLNQARKTGTSTAGSAAAAPFGAGIHSGRGSGGSPSVGGASPKGAIRDGARPAGNSVASGSPGKSTVPAVVLRASAQRSSSGGEGSVLALLGGGIAVLVLGGFGGVVMRRSHRGDWSGGDDSSIAE